ncbi:glycoside hydrolase family 79 protein [Plicaturopsis crispa FD-325 SS-3]|uniref:Glycoside hydrolase family 79 protein n=1 Tax=Plicaturopsis crispa FD-325 SS-3 TaxID=944288 RepID=A0A0C9SYI3_PLICR|nr:glycoside hydrolase family 79 protein [Plicaturopsis crispa FD-325 SS-3]
MLILSVVLALLTAVRGSVTVYGVTPTTAAASANYTGSAAYDTTVLNAPEVPSPAPATQFTLALNTASSSVNGLSIAQSGTFLGFSVEFSVINQVLGINSSFLQVPFLNLMASLKQRAGAVYIRVGGNSQETATLVASLASGKMIEKDNVDTSNPTETPTLDFTPEVLYMLANISALVNAKWYLGIPLNDSSNLRLGIAEVGESVLGDNLLGFQVGNEPDLYADHGHRPSTYSPYDYFGEFGVVVAALNADNGVPTRPVSNLIGPSVATGDWTPEMVWNTGFVSSYSSSLGALAVEHYPDNNCAAQFNTGGAVIDPQTVFSNYLNHTSGKNIISPYLNSSAFALANGKPFLMFETNTASCGGFPGVSDSFGSALWMADYALQMAYSNFSGALLHVGGQDDYYNPFTPPPTNQSSYHQWTIGPIFYATLVVAEAFGTSGKSQIIDLGANSDSIYTPAYAIYENGVPARVALFNYITDATGANDMTVTISIGGSGLGESNGTPSQVQVKYLAAPSVAEKYNITWAGQTYGDNFESDGRLQGSESIQTISCDTNANTCQIPVPAPGLALVFLSSDALSEVSPSTTQTFATTSVTKTANTATVPASVLATSNGHSGSTWRLSSTSKESSGVSAMMMPSMGVLGALVFGTIILGRTMYC